ncbi:MAG: hypothetical protein ACE5HX_02200 [bacterium]
MLLSRYYWILVFLFLSSPLVWSQEMKLPIPPDKEKEALEFLEENAPFRLNRIGKLKQFRPEQYHRILLEVMERQRMLAHLELEDPERAELIKKQIKLENKTEELGHDFRISEDEAEKANLEKELKRALSELFDLRELDKQREIERLEKQLQELKNMVKKRKGHREEIIQKRLDQMLGKEDYLAW